MPQVNSPSKQHSTSSGAGNGGQQAQNAVQVPIMMGSPTPVTSGMLFQLPQSLLQVMLAFDISPIYYSFLSNVFILLKRRKFKNISKYFLIISLV